jgi:hypothetical protein
MEDLVVTRAYLKSLPEQERQARIKREIYNYAHMIRTNILSNARAGHTGYGLRRIDILNLTIDPEYPRLVREQLQQWFPDCTFRTVSAEQGYFIVSWE